MFKIGDYVELSLRTKSNGNFSPVLHGSLFKISGYNPGSSYPYIIELLYGISSFPQGMMFTAVESDLEYAGTTPKTCRPVPPFPDPLAIYKIPDSKCPLFTTKCECGCSAVGSSNHSDYCPLYSIA